MMQNSSLIRVFLVDDQTMIRAGFKSLIARDPRFEVVGDSGDPRAAIDMIAKLQPDVVVLDISMPGLSGIDAISHIRKVHPKVKVLMLTHHEGESFVIDRPGRTVVQALDPSELALNAANDHHYSTRSHTRLKGLA